MVDGLMTGHQPNWRGFWFIQEKQLMTNEEKGVMMCHAMSISMCHTTSTSMCHAMLVKLTP
jgi:hypothetical protein